jgi:hypothetical protein
MCALPMSVPVAVSSLQPQRGAGWLIYEYNGVHAPEVPTGHLSVFETLLELRSLTYLVALERIVALSI